MVVYFTLLYFIFGGLKYEAPSDPRHFTPRVHPLGQQVTMEFRQGKFQDLWTLNSTKN